MSVPVLVLDGHTPQALACVRSLGRAGYPVYVAGRYRRPLAAWSRWSAGYIRVPEAPRAYADLRHWAVGHGVKIVLPMTERSCLLCNAERHRWQEAAIAVGCGPEAMLLRAFDKAQTIEAAAACSVAVPPTWSPTSKDECRAAAEAVGFPCVVKSRFSDVLVDATCLRGGGTGYVARPADLDGVVQARRQGTYWPIIQGFVGGKGKGVSGLCDHGHIVALFAHERLREVRPTGSGSSLRRSIKLDARLRSPAERLLKQLDWHGPVMVEFRDDGSHAPWLMEVNGRFWGSLQLAIAAGIDIPRWWVAMLEDRPVPSANGYPEGITLRWLWGDVKRFLNILGGPPDGFGAPYPTRRQGLKELLGVQPEGSRLEIWQREDPWPGVGEWVQGLSELVGHGWRFFTADGRRQEVLEPGRQTRPPESSPGSAATRDLG